MRYRRIRGPSFTEKSLRGSRVCCQGIVFWDKLVCMVGTNVLEELDASIFTALGCVFCLEDGGCRLFRKVGAV
jgi:hypothetical protein